MTTTTATPPVKHVFPAPDARAVGRAMFEAIEPHQWDDVPENFHKLYTTYGQRVIDTLREQGIRAVQPLPVLAPDLETEIREWRHWWKGGRIDHHRTTRKAHEILVDLGERLR